LRIGRGRGRRMMVMRRRKRREKLRGGKDPKLREKSMPLHTVQSERGGPLRRGASEGYLFGWWRAIVGECHLLVVLLTR
jgi:hypothetical protein